MFRFCILLSLVLGISFYRAQVPLAAPVLHIVAAENFYGALATEIGGSYVEVKSILNQPDQDPHLFNVTPSIAKSLAKADLVILNGLGYDPWMEGLLSATTIPARTVICVANLLHKREGENPHIWYDPATMPRLAEALASFLKRKDPLHQSFYQINYQHFMERYVSLESLIQQLSLRTQGMKVLATEPVFDYMAKALGFDMQGLGFQLSMMNGVDPTPGQVQRFQEGLKSHRIVFLFYNKQASNTLVQQLLKLAQIHAVPIIGVTETQPSNKTYIEWMLDPLKQIEMILNERHYL